MADMCETLRTYAPDCMHASFAVYTISIRAGTSRACSTSDHGYLELLQVLVQQSSEALHKCAARR